MSVYIYSFDHTEAKTKKPHRKQLEIIFYRIYRIYHSQIILKMKTIKETMSFTTKLRKETKLIFGVMHKNACGSILF